ncbi:MAG: alpha/beta hydrolase [Candidatus Onthomonas sp.]
MKSVFSSITPELRLGDLLSLPEFASIRSHLLIDDFFSLSRHGDVPLSALSDTWNIPLLCEGLNRALALRRAGYPLLYASGPEPSQFFFHFPGNPGGKAVIICPGGGYSLVWSPGEGYPVAARLNAMGYHAFVVNYRTGPGAAQAPNPMEDLAVSIRYILAHAGQFQADLSDYAVMGFSAGGHLAASFGTEALGWRHYGLPRPGTMMLCYPVITMGPLSEPTSRACLLGEHLSDPDFTRRYSVEQQITPAYPPTYLWQCDSDAVVPIQNSQLLARQLAAQQILHRYQTYPGTDHGTGLADGTAAQGWLEQAVSFWREQLSR